MFHASSFSTPQGQVTAEDEVDLRKHYSAAFNHLYNKLQLLRHIICNTTFMNIIIRTQNYIDNYCKPKNTCSYGPTRSFDVDIFLTIITKL